MAAATLHPDFERAFVDGASLHIMDEMPEGLYQDVVVQTQHIADLVLTTGHIVACDPFVFAGDTPPYSLTIAPGLYPVMLSSATVGPDHRRVACAKVQFRTGTAVRWDMALLPGQDIKTLETGKFFCYGVDAGTGCFGDAEALAELDKRQRADDDQAYFNEMDSALMTNGGEWAAITFAPETQANCVIFHSGWGDGCYASWWGFNAAGEILCLVTDFGVL